MWEKMRQDHEEPSSLALMFSTVSKVFTCIRVVRMLQMTVFTGLLGLSNAVPEDMSDLST